MADLVLKDKILQGNDFRGRIFDSAKVRFNSVFESTFAYMQIPEGGNFTGNGWEQCNFFKCDIAGLKMILDRFRRCSFGSACFAEICCDEITVRECFFAGSSLDSAKIDKCRFENCNFREMRICGSVLDRCVFIRCIFDGVSMEESILRGARFTECIFRDRAVPFNLDGSTMKFVNCKGKRSL